MSYPALNEYTEVIQNPRIALTDQTLKSCNVKTNAFGLPVAACGGFALTFTLENSINRKYVVRCFHKEVRDLSQRYQAISQKLNYISSEYFVNFEYQPQGIKVRGQYFPIVKMEWASGEILGQFVEKNVSNYQKIHNLRESLKKLYSYLQSVHIAHGDIQPGNVMVSNTGKTLQLIDYDGMFVEALAPLGASEAGHRNFQHPAREHVRPWNFGLDNFSFISIDLALAALEIDASLWEETQSDGDKFLFSANDFYHPDSSKIFSKLYKIPQLSVFIKRFIEICKGAYHDIPTFFDFIGSKNTSVSCTVKNTTTTSSHKKYISAFPVLSATNYALFLDHIGERVELVGKVTDLKRGRTKFNSPYIFLNFGNWRGNIVKLAAWNEAIKAIGDQKLIDLKDKWISITGFVEAPYSNSKYGYSHITITIQPSNPPHLITEAEAKFRLSPQGETATTTCIEPSECAYIGTGKIDISGVVSRNTDNARKMQEITKRRQMQGIGVGASAQRSNNTQSQSLSSSYPNHTSLSYNTKKTTLGNRNIQNQNHIQDLEKKLQELKSRQMVVNKSTPVSNPSPKSSPCFIATALYGSNHKKTNRLRKWRDDVLKKTWYGRVFIYCYYLISPSVSKLIKNNIIIYNFFYLLIDFVVYIVSRHDK